MKKNDKYVLHNNLKFYRELCDLTQSELGFLCSVSKNTISSIEIGTTSPSITLALVICSILDNHCPMLKVTIDDVFYL